MEQMELLLTEYHSYITLALAGLAVILLLAALHRIKKVQKLLKQFQGKSEQQYLELRKTVGQNLKTADYHETDREEAKSMSGSGAFEAQAVSEALRKMNQAGEKAVREQSAQQKKTPGETQEDLLNAVLEEVFP